MVTGWQYRDGTMEVMSMKAFIQMCGAVSLVWALSLMAGSSSVISQSTVYDLSPSYLAVGLSVIPVGITNAVQVAADNASLEVDFRHPATGEVRRMTFYVDNQTGLSGIDTLQELRAGQIVNIDYVEGEKHRLLIRRIARVKLSGPPAGLEKFHGL